MEEYVIPDEKKAEVLKALYVFFPVPSLDEEQLDILLFQYRRDRGRMNLSKLADR